jgi:hypothetical protein
VRRGERRSMRNISISVQVVIGSDREQICKITTVTLRGLREWSPCIECSAKRGPIKSSGGPIRYSVLQCLPSTAADVGLARQSSSVGLFASTESAPQKCGIIVFRADYLRIPSLCPFGRNFCGDNDVFLGVQQGGSVGTARRGDRATRFVCRSMQARVTGPASPFGHPRLFCVFALVLCDSRQRGPGDPESLCTGQIVSRDVSRSRDQNV